MTTAILDDLQTKLRSRAAERDARYRQLVTDVVAGHDVDPGTVEQILLAAGKTAEDLTHDLQKRKRRAELLAIRAKGIAAEDQILELKTSIAAAQETFNQAVAAARVAFHDATAPQSTALELAYQAVRTQTSTTAELLRSCPDHALRARYDELVRQLAGNDKAQRIAADRVHTFGTSRDDRAHKGDKAGADAYDAIVKRDEATLVQLKEQQASLLSDRDLAELALMEG